MPRLVHKQPTYFHHKASNRARVRCGGKDHYLPGDYGSPESLRAYADLLESLKDTGTVHAASKPGDEPAPILLTIAELVEKYWDHAQVYYRRDSVPTGEADVIRAALRPTLQMFGHLLVEDFKPKHLKQAREEMIRRGWTRRYINAAIRRTRRMFRWGVEEELVPAEVSGTLAAVTALKEGRTAAREKPQVGSVPDDRIEAVLPHVSPLVSDLIRFIRLTGARPGEALSMTAAEVDRSDLRCWEFRPTRHKTSHRGKKRTVFIGPRAREIVARRIAKAGSGRVFPITKGGLRKALLKGCDRASPHPTLSKMKAEELTAAQRAELRSWRKANRFAPNQLRHAAATAIREEHGLEASQVILGHARADVTEIYAETSQKRGREIASKVG
jgi:integrase